MYQLLFQTYIYLVRGFYLTFNYLRFFLLQTQILISLFETPQRRLWFGDLTVFYVGAEYF